MIEFLLDLQDIELSAVTFHFLLRTTLLRIACFLSDKWKLNGHQADSSSCRQFHVAYCMMQIFLSRSLLLGFCRPAPSRSLSVSVSLSVAVAASASASESVCLCRSSLPRPSPCLSVLSLTRTLTLSDFFQPVSPCRSVSLLLHFLKPLKTSGGQGVDDPHPLSEVKFLVEWWGDEKQRISTSLKFATRLVVQTNSVMLATLDYAAHAVLPSLSRVHVVRSLHANFRRRAGLTRLFEGGASFHWDAVPGKRWGSDGEEGGWVSIWQAEKPIVAMVSDNRKRRQVAVMARC
eukprot:757448-Hanusia_phi.AAC.1